MKLYTNNILKLLAKILREELGSNWDNLIKYAINLNDPAGGYTDVNGVPIAGRSDVNVYYLNTYDKTGEVHKEIADKFSRSTRILKGLPGLDRTFIAFIGPNSVIPSHIDDLNRPAFDPSSRYNVLLGVQVPSDNIEQIGLRVNTESVNHCNDYAVAFDANIPHDAWNKTNEWWICIVLLTDKDYVKS